MEGKMTLFGLSAQMAQIEDELYENGGELTPELEKELTETRESLVAKVDGYNALYQKYQEMAAHFPNLHLLGRLAEYKYYNMDAIAGRALDLAETMLTK